jgi:hypothetical protein
MNINTLPGRQQLLLVALLTMTINLLTSCNKSQQQPTSDMKEEFRLDPEKLQSAISAALSNLDSNEFSLPSPPADNSPWIARRELDNGRPVFDNSRWCVTNMDSFGIVLVSYSDPIWSKNRDKIRNLFIKIQVADNNYNITKVTLQLHTVR